MLRIILAIIAVFKYVFGGGYYNDYKEMIEEGKKDDRF